MDAEALIHFVGGALGGTAGTTLTCPFEVVKTRMQSSEHILGQKLSNTNSPSSSSTSSDVSRQSIYRIKRFLDSKGIIAQKFAPSNLRLFDVVKGVYNEGGIRAFYKGLFPNLVGVAPSKAIYFWVYSYGKRSLNNLSPEFQLFGGWRPVPDSAVVHMASAAFAGGVTATVINPIWLVKTRLQLSHVPLKTFTCVSRIYKKEGLSAFWKGVSASYLGVFETMIQFVVYEHLRQRLENPKTSSSGANFTKFMIAGAISKFVACIMVYPHEVLRTRLREEGAHSRGIRKIAKQIWKEGALYRGLSVQLMRSVPNTALTMGTYELVIHMLHNFFLPHSHSENE